MLAFEVHDMTCGHCVSAITQALKALDADATVAVDLAAHRVQIESAVADARAVADALSDAGYSPRLIGAQEVKVGKQDGHA